MKYHFAAEIPKELADDVRQAIDRVRSSPEPGDHREEGAELVLRLTRACLNSYFLQPVRLLEVGFMAEKATEVGVAAAYRAIAVFVRRITGSLSGDQVLRLADLLDGMLLSRRAPASGS